MEMGTLRPMLTALAVSALIIVKQPIAIMKIVHPSHIWTRYCLKTGTLIAASATTGAMTNDRDSWLTLDPIGDASLHA